MIDIINKVKGYITTKNETIMQDYKLKLSDYFTDKREINNILHKRIFYNRFKYILSIYFSNDFKIIFLVVFIITILAILLKTNGLKNDEIQNLIMINAGIGTIIISLSIFIATTLNDKSEPEKGRILLSRSNVLGLMISEVLIFLLLLCLPHWIIILPIIFIAIYSVFSFYRIIEIMTSYYKMEDEKKELLFKLIIKNFLNIDLFQEYKQKGKEKLIEISEKNQLFELNEYKSYNRNEYICIKAQQKGFVIDINVRRLIKFIKELSRFTIDSKLAREDIENITPDSQAIKKQICFLRSSYFDEINEDSDIIVLKRDQLRNDLTKNQIEYIEEYARSIFEIGSVDDYVDQIKTEMSRIKHRCVKAIQEIQYDEMKLNIKFYIELYEKLREESNFKNISKNICNMSTDWIVNDINEIFSQIIKNNNIEIIIEITGLMQSLAIKSLDYKDMYLFDNFLSFTRKLYDFSYEKEKSGKNRDAIILLDRSWRYPDELIKYFIIPKVRKGDISVNEFKNYIQNTFSFFNKILKSSFDKNKINDFKRFLNKIEELLSDIGMNYNNVEIDSISDIKLFINKNKQMIYFGLSSWILNKMKIESDTIKHEEINEFYSCITKKIANNINDLTNVYMNIIETESNNKGYYREWFSWEMEEKENGRVHRIDFRDKLSEFYIIHSLCLLKSMREEGIDIIKLHYNLDFIFNINSENGLIQILNEIKCNSEKWAFILDDERIKKVEKFKEILKNYIEKQEEYEKQQKREKHISEKKVKEFKRKFVEGFNSSSRIRNIMKNEKLYEDRTNEIGTGLIKEIGINTIAEKAMFFEKWHINYVFLGGEGSGLGTLENEIIVNEVRKECEKHLKFIFNVNKLDNLLSKMVGDKDWSNVFIIVVGDAINKFLYTNGIYHQGYIPQWRTELMNDEEIYKFNNHDIPLFHIITQNRNYSNIFVLNKLKLGKLIQYKPTIDSKRVEKIKDILYMDVQEYTINNELREKLINEAPEWLRNKGNSEKQKDYLNEKVLIEIYERFKFEIHEKFEGFISTE